MKLNSIGIKIFKNSKRVGRGIGSGKGKTAGRGVKGQKARSGVAVKSFEGGQMPLYRRLPKRGFNAIKNRANNLVINLRDISSLIDKKKINTVEKIDLSSLLFSKDKKNSKYVKVKILGTGEIKHKVNLLAHSFSQSAKSKIEKLGGSIEIVK
ncbi:MAG: 50S ribosomal protein L15 [Proteobacteria bacterium]|jgi:large subunit ribosomal protein L15|nr:50S ribosomal protein L15 [Pseudomonadota bacterium]